ncbi:MAG: hypothetical protein ACLFVU_04275 [Phycisphaerae bacterium]
MRWILFIILAYLFVVFQSSLGGVFAFFDTPVGTIGPDFVAILAMFVTLRARSRVDVLLAAWILGMAVDITTAGGPGGLTVIGPMALGYLTSASLLYLVREAVFQERPIAQAFLSLLFVLVAHGVWVSLQSIVAWSQVSWGDYGQMLLRAVGVAVYSGIVGPLVLFGLSAIKTWFIPAPSSRRQRR